MKLMILVFTLLVMADFAFGQAPITTSTAAVAAPVTPVVVAAPPAVTSPTPPAWIVSALSAIEALPVVGPIVSKGIQYLAIFGSFMTILAGFVMGLIKLLGPYLASGTATEVQATVTKWLNSPIVTWLRYVSFFQKPAPAVAVVKKA